MKVLRYSALAAVAMFAAACGDKVTVAGPTAVTLTSTTTTTTTPVVPGKVNSITVAPAAVTLTVGQAVTLVAAVNADAGVATTHTWSTSDATKVSVSAAGLVTAVAATPGVAICATSTVNTGVKGCGSVVVTAATAVTPASVSFNGVFQTSLTQPVTPSAVSGTVFAQLNIDPGTQVISKVYLMLGTTIVDSQNYSAAQSAALRYAAENAGAATTSEAAAEVSSQVVLTWNTAAYNATTGVGLYANGADKKLSAQVWLTGGTAAAATASYSTGLTLDNADGVSADWTLPSTAVKAVDAAGYQWTGFGGGTATLAVLPIIYSGKTVASGTATQANMTGPSAFCTLTVLNAAGCTVLGSNDTTTAKTVNLASNKLSFVFQMFDREYDRTVTLSAPTPMSLTFVYSDGSSRVYGSLSAATALRIDNKGPARPAFVAPAYLTSLSGAITATSTFQGKAVLGYRPSILSTLTDSATIVSTVGADGGVSNGAVVTDLRGTTFKFYRNTGGVSSTAADTLQTTFTEVADRTTLTAAGATSETGKYCLKAVQYDRLGNASLPYKDGSVKTLGSTVGYGCQNASSAANGVVFSRIDNTAPVAAWNAASYSQADTAVSAASPTAVSANYYYSLTDSSTLTHTPTATLYTYATGAKVTVCPITQTTTCSYTPAAAVGGLFNITNGTNSLANLSGATYAANGQYVMSIVSSDDAGNIGTTISRVFVADNTAPTGLVAPAVVTTTLGAALSTTAYGTDAVSLAKSAPALVSGFSIGTEPQTQLLLNDFAATGLDVMGATAFTKFLSTAITHANAAYDSPAFVIDSDLTGTLGAGGGTSLFGTTALITASPQYGAWFADHANNVNSISAATAMTYNDIPALATNGMQSYYIGSAAGMENLSSAAMFTTSTLSSAALGKTAASGITTSTVYTTAITYYRFQGKRLAYFNNADFTKNKLLCSDTRTANSVMQYQTDGTELQTPHATAMTDRVLTSGGQVTIPLNAGATRARVIVRTVGGWVGVGDATKIGSVVSATANCLQTVTDTYQYTFTPGAQRVLLPYNTVSGANLKVAYSFGKGLMLIGKGSPVFTYTTQ